MTFYAIKSHGKLVEVPWEYPRGLPRLFEKYDDAREFLVSEQRIGGISTDGKVVMVEVVERGN